MSDKLPMLTASRLRDARACQRLQFYKYVRGYRPLGDVGPLRFGAMFHEALEAWWGALDCDKLNEAMLTIQSDADPFEAAMARALLVGYDERWQGQDLEVLSVEGQFNVPLVNPQTGASSKTWTLAGKFDAIARETSGRVLLVEHKTTSSEIAPGSDYWKMLRLDGQVSIYFEGARASGYDVAACLYDVIRKPGIRPLKATPQEDRKFKKDGTPYSNQRTEDETPDEFEARLSAAIGEDPNRYFARGEVVRLESEMDEAMYDVWSMGRQLRESELADRWPRNPDSCVRFGRTCEFFSVCCNEATLEDPLLFKKLDSPHPELGAVGDRHSATSQPPRSLAAINLTAEREG